MGAHEGQEREAAQGPHTLPGPYSLAALAATCSLGSLPAPQSGQGRNQDSACVQDQGLRLADSATRSRLHPWGLTGGPAFSPSPAQRSPHAPPTRAHACHHPTSQTGTPTLCPGCQLPAHPRHPSSLGPAQSPEGGDLHRGGFQMAVIPCQWGLDTCPASSHPPLRLPKHICTSQLARGSPSSATAWASCSGVGSTVSTPHPRPHFTTPKHRQVPKARHIAVPASSRRLSPQITLAHFLGMCEAWRHWCWEQPVCGSRREARALWKEPSGQDAPGREPGRPEGKAPIAQVLPRATTWPGTGHF